MYLCSECDRMVWVLTNGLCKRCLEDMRLTPRQEEVSRLFRDGLNKHQIADALYISPNTVEIHLTGARKKGAFDDLPGRGDGRYLRGRQPRKRDANGRFQTKN